MSKMTRYKVTRDVIGSVTVWLDAVNADEAESAGTAVVEEKIEALTLATGIEFAVTGSGVAEIADGPPVSAWHCRRCGSCDVVQLGWVAINTDECRDLSDADPGARCEACGHEGVAREVEVSPADRAKWIDYDILPGAVSEWLAVHADIEAQASDAVSRLGLRYMADLEAAGDEDGC